MKAWLLTEDKYLYGHFSQAAYGYCQSSLEQTGSSKGVSATVAYFDQVAPPE